MLQSFPSITAALKNMKYFRKIEKLFVNLYPPSKAAWIRQRWTLINDILILLINVLFLDLRWSLFVYFYFTMSLTWRLNCYIVFYNIHSIMSLKNFYLPLSHAVIFLFLEHSVRANKIYFGENNYGLKILKNHREERWSAKRNWSMCLI